METSSALSLKSCSWIGFERVGKKPNSLSRFSPGERSLQKLNLRDCNSRNSVLIRYRPVASKISCSYEKATVPEVESETSHTSFDEALILKRNAEDVLRYLNGRCIYLVGMMGSGKTTVGKILSEALGYSFMDSDKLVEKAVDGTPVAQIFEDHGEAFFRDNESEVLRGLSLMCRLVVATGGGAVIRPINWKYMKKGISVWLDVPLEALARRIAAVGTDSRPLLHQESGDAYTESFTRLTKLFGEREEAYTNADATVSLQRIAAKWGHADVCVLTPTAIAMEALLQIKNFLDAESNGRYL